MTDTMAWFAILVVYQVLVATSFVEADLNLECPTGYEIKDSYCYKKVFATFPWEKAEDACEREGSQLVWIDDWEENDYVQKLLPNTSGEMFWIGLHQTDNDWRWTGSSSVYDTKYGFWEPQQPEGNAKCVAGMVNGNWKLEPCQQMLPFICKTTAYPQGSFKCSKGPAISSMHQCDGCKDCEDGSDELQCDRAPQCNWYSTRQSGTQMISYQRSKTCLYTLKVDIGQRIMLTLSSLIPVELRADSLKVFSGGNTLSESYEIGSVTGFLSQGQRFISGNNYIIVRITTDSSVEGQPITMSWTNAVPDVFNSARMLSAPSYFVTLQSPFYGEMLPADLAMAWDITALTEGQVITVMFDMVDLESRSSLELYDGGNMYDAVLSGIRSIPDPAMYISYSRTIRIKLSTYAAYQSSSNGFSIRYMEGCQNTITPANYGTILTPGFKTGYYPRGVSCSWTILAPASKKLTLRKESFNIVANVDYMKVYNNTNTPVHTGSGYTGDINSPLVITSDTGYIKVEFISDKVRTGNGFKLTYSIDCEPLTPSMWTSITPNEMPYTSFRSTIVVTCEEGYSFTQEEYNQMSSVPMICEAGGNWNVSRNPDCSTFVG
ncbi:cubilin-like [Ylistrum balloti]|uniref:cubilin-like n=1 Tax=Ylistrum balloti TaxID=509963 RepID=UPI002905CA83|nr:cubilin-like [Ylistrum balloti]